ncbi:hypothetical protein QBC46DRAFT_397949 [Diplogelasinospora grovesii]|uniref:Uncharacterized protein n=1 Tax=Diplogelasinospora grovesii TaxID=303347 RepID=A0AAN6MZ66_9PEZI|nr:hypothetical protein QBC46DRAFT_397949 [Diplogelasinospora grovesii]
MMSRVFRRPSSHKTMVSPRQDEEDPHSAYSSLLDPATVSANQQQQHQPHRRAKSSPTNDYPTTSTRPSRWLGDSRSSWTGGERPPTRKLVKDPNGSGRPSFSLELLDSVAAAEKDKGIVWRHIARLKELYRRADK